MNRGKIKSARPKQLPLPLVESAAPQAPAVKPTGMRPGGYEDGARRLTDHILGIKPKGVQ